MSDEANLYWDACVFIHFITKQPSEGWADLDQFVLDSRHGKRKIYYSTISFVEIRRRYFAGTAWGDFQDFCADFKGAFSGIGADPNIMIRAGELRDAVPINPNPKDEKDPNVRKRVIGTADAIHLMTCLHLRDVREIKDIVFHTYDSGHNRGHEGKCVPLLDFERWFPEGKRTKEIGQVCGLRRSRPVFAQGSLELIKKGNGIERGEKSRNPSIDGFSPEAGADLG
jgi:hypothetical protein